MILIMPPGCRIDKETSSTKKRRPRAGGVFRQPAGWRMPRAGGGSSDPAGATGYFIVTFTPEAEPAFSDRPLEVVPIVMITPFSFFRCSIPAPAPAAPLTLNAV